MSIFCKKIENCHAGGILFKEEAGSDLGFYTHQSFWGILYTKNFFFIFGKIKKENIHILVGFCKKK